MPTISLRLSDEIEAQLSHEAQLEGRARSEVVREAIVEYIERHERERFMAEMVAAAKALAADPDSQQEAREIAEDLVDEGLDSLIAKESAAGIDPGGKWWR
ncbi:MAG: ribbon-helix-helix domain-containing protein [Chromatiales bacterium]|nr:ribbon-helix-helix protein, CopG family [Gammaproteobacteria bacterium]MBW6477241.1 ribbon-helix-helix domain-containing protein [Chromatiales bacterium]